MRNTRALVLLGALAALGAIVLWNSMQGMDGNRLPEPLAVFDLARRPQAERYLYDYAGVLSHYEEGAHRYLKRIDSRFHIEAMVVTVADVPAGHSLETLAVDLVNNWRIGEKQEGRGLLLLLVDASKQVKLEVSYALEDVFTDSFSGFVEDLQLGPNYRAGELGTGLMAVMEMLEQRAEIKDQGDYTPAQIAQADAELLAGGAGARRALKPDKKDAASTNGTQGTGRGADTPEQAWKIMLDQWAGEGKDVDTDIYTQMTRLAMGDPTKPDPRTRQALDHWRNADYRVLVEGGHAVIWFGAIDGWNNAPFLFCNTGDGWKFDIVHQRRLVVMGEAPKWQVAQGPYPYLTLMYEARQSTGKDLPLSADDLYRCTDDATIAERMRHLQGVLQHSPGDLEATSALARLNVITGQRPGQVSPLLKRAKELAPERADLYKYSAIYNVNSFFQYETALKDIERYIRLRPDDAFGYQLKGFLLYRLGRYRDSINVLEESISQDADSGYPYMLMARDYTLLYRKASGVTKDGYRKKALAMQRKAATVSSPDWQRLAWLEQWLSRRLKR